MLIGLMSIIICDAGPAITAIVFNLILYPLNPLTAGAAYIRVFIFQHSKYHILNMLKIKCDISQQYLKTVDLHFVKSE